MYAGFLFVLFVGVLANTLISTNAQSSAESASSSQSDGYLNVTTPNPSRLTAAEISIILSSGFFTQGNKLVDFGTVWLLALFEKYPEYKEQYRRFKDIPNYCLLNNKEFRQVSFNYTHALSDLIHSIILENISNVDLWRKWPYLAATSGYNQKDMDVVQDVFISTLRCGQPNFNQAHSDVWNKAWSIIWRNYVAGARQAQGQSG